MKSNRYVGHRSKCCIVHRLNMDPDAKVTVQKKRVFTLKRQRVFIENIQAEGSKVH